MHQTLLDTQALLARTPATLDTLLRDLPATWTCRHEGKCTWNATGVVGHLAYCERADWMPRVRMILECGEARTFEPLDRFAFIPASEGKSLGELLDDFARLRARNLQDLDSLHLDTAHLSLRGRHPALGVVTLSELLAAWAMHDLTHLHQITRVMAFQYKDAVGPFRRFLGVLQCEGHSSPA
ncbi:MAG: DinB family protein [Acidobacteriaceae bacterium]|jgi:DinB superfamily